MEAMKSMVRAKTGLLLDPLLSPPPKITWISGSMFSGAREKAAEQGKLAFGTVDSAG